MEKKIKQHLTKLFTGIAKMSMNFCKAKVKTTISSIDHDIIELAHTQVSMVTRTGQQFVFFPHMGLSFCVKENGIFSYNSQTTDTIKDMIEDILSTDFSLSEGVDGEKNNFIMVKKAILNEFWEKLDSFAFLEHDEKTFSGRVKKLQSNYKLSVNFKKLGFVSGIYADGTHYHVFCIEMRVYGFCDLYEQAFHAKEIITGHYSRNRLFLKNNNRELFSKNIYPNLYSYISILEDLSF